MMELFPAVQPEAEPTATDSLPLCRETAWDFIQERPIYSAGEPVEVTGAEAVRVWVWKALKTARCRYDIYTWDFGCEAENLVGRPFTAQVKESEAACVIRFTGSDGAQAPAGTPFYTEAGLAFALEETVILAGGTGEGRLVCQEVGRKGNIAPGEITQTLRNYTGIDSYTNEAATGGVDRESDEALLERYLARMRRTATSGNPYHYQQWADSVEGVGASRVIAKWNGPGTVKVILAGQDFGPAPEEVVTACGAYIEHQRPVGAEVTVTAAQGVELAVTATVSIDGTTTKGKVQTAFQAALAAYLAGLVKTAFTRNLDGELDDVAGQRYTVSYNRVSALLLSVPGVIDHTALTVAGGTASVSVPADGVPVLTEVTVT